MTHNNYCDDDTRWFICAHAQFYALHSEVSKSVRMDLDSSLLLLDSFSSHQPSVEVLDSFDSLDLQVPGDEVRNAAESISIEIMDSFSSDNTSDLADGVILDDHCCTARADFEFDQSYSCLQATSTPRKTPLLMELDDRPAANGKRIRYAEGLRY